MAKLTLQTLDNFPMIEPGDDLVEIIASVVTKQAIDIEENDILVLAQKIVSKAENRYRNLSDVVPSAEANQYAERTDKDPRLLELILSESKKVLRCRSNLIIVEHKLGFVCANAGIDHSNVFLPEGHADDWVLLLPEDPEKSANKIAEGLSNRFGKQVGVLIIDSHGRAWRNGIIGTCIGLAGVPGLVDMRGSKDLFGYNLRATLIGAADELAAAASLVMGQAKEGTPVVHVRGFPYPLRKGSYQELIRPEAEDMFR